MPPKPKLIWSPYQEAIFKDVNSGAGNTIIVARAGAAKSSSIIEAGSKHIPRGKKALFIAFNTIIAKNLEERLQKSYIQASTVHSAGYKAIRQRFPKIKLDPQKSLNLINLQLSKLKFNKQDKTTFETASNLARAVSLCKSSIKDTPSQIDDMLDQFDIDTLLLDRDQFISLVCKTLGQCKANTDCVDYDDMIWYPNCFNLPLHQYDIVIIDELQDLSPAQINIALNSCKHSGRIIGVGDPAQSCYSWRGSEINAIEKLTKRLSAKTLTLPISYRCPKSVIRLAQTIVPDIQASPSAKEGFVKHISEDDMFKLIKPGDFLLSRINAPLIYACLKLINAGKPSNIQGRDVANGLLWMIKKSECKDLTAFNTWLDKWEATETKRLRDKNRSPLLVEDKAACLRNLIAETKTIEGLSDKLKELFRDGDDTTDRCILSSIHRSKGLERDRVFILTKTLRSDSVEEDNLRYIAYTRSKSELYLVD